MRSLCRETGAFSGTYRRTTSPNGSDCQSVRHGLMACPYSKFSAFCNFFREKLADMGKSSYLCNVKNSKRQEVAGFTSGYFYVQSIIG